MAAFKFRLSRLFRVRAIQEEMARNQWAQVERQAGMAATTISALETELRNARNDLSERLADGELSVPGVILAHRTTDALEERLQTTRERWLTLREQSDRLRRVWEGQRMEWEGIRRLEDRDRSRFRISTRLAEAAEIDELAIIRKARTRGDQETLTSENDHEETA